MHKLILPFKKLHNNSCLLHAYGAIEPLNFLSPHRLVEKDGMVGVGLNEQIFFTLFPHLLQNPSERAKYSWNKTQLNSSQELIKCLTCSVSALLKLSKEHKMRRGEGSWEILHLIKQADQGNIREMKQYSANKKSINTSKKTHLIYHI